MTTLLLTCLGAIIVLVIAVCCAVHFCNLHEVNIHANVLKLANVSFSVTSRSPQEDRSPVPKKRKNPRERARQGDR